MANWFYYDDQGQKQGPITVAQLNELRERGEIRPETIIESEYGGLTKSEKISKLGAAGTLDRICIALDDLGDRFCKTYPKLFPNQGQTKENR